MAVIVGLLVILTTSLVASPQDIDGASLPISALSSPPTQQPPVYTKTNTTASLSTKQQTNLLLQPNVSQTDYVSNFSQPLTEIATTPIQQSNTSDITTVAVTTTASEKIATTTDVSLPDTTTITQPSQTPTSTTVSPITTTNSTPSFTTPHTAVTSTNTTSRTTIVTTSTFAPNTTSDINTTTTSFPPSSIPPSSVSPTTTPTTNVPLTSPTTSPSAPHHTGTSIVLTLFILVAVILLIGAGVWWVRRRRQLERLRHQLMPMYNFDPTDDLDDWENQLLEEERSLRPEADKVQLYSGNATFEAAQKATQNDTGPKD